MTYSSVTKLSLVFVSAAVLLSTGCSSKAKVERHTERGDAYFAQEEWDKARLEYLNAIRADPQNVHVAFQLAEIFLKQHDFGPARQFYLHVRDLQPTNIPARLKLGSLFLARSENLKARAEAEAILKISPQDSDGAILLANTCTTTADISAAKMMFESQLGSAETNAVALFALGLLSHKSDLDAAETYFRKAISLSGKQSKYYLALANTCWASKKTNETAAAFKSALSLASSPDSIELLRYVDFLISTEQFDAAKSLLEEALAKAPNSPDVQNRLAQIAIVQQNYDAAATHIAKTLSNYPKNRDALIHRSRIQLSKGDFDGAKTSLEALNQSFPGDSRVRFNLALAYLGLNDTSKALANLDQAVTLDPGYTAAVLLRSDLQIGKRDLSSAVPNLLRLTKEFPHLTKASYLLGSAYRQQANFSEAIKVYSSLTNKIPSDPEPYQFLGVSYRQWNKPEAARQAFEAALRIDPDYLLAIDDLVNLDILGNATDRALERIQEYIRKNPKKPEFHFLHAKVLAAQRKTDQAISALQKAIDLNPDYYAAHYALAELYVQNSKTDEGITRFQSLLAKNKNEPGLYLRLAVLLEHKGDYKGALSYYESLLQVNPNAPLPLISCAQLLAARLGEMDRALEYAQKARELDPGDPEIADTLGWILFEKRNYARALPLFQEAAGRLATPVALSHLGMAYYMTGAEKPAMALLEKALQAKNDFRQRQQATDALAILKIDPKAEDAIPRLQKAIAQNSNDFFAYYRLAQAHESQKAWNKAQDAYVAALNINPQTQPIITRLAELNAIVLDNPARGLAYAKQAWNLSQNIYVAPFLAPVAYLAGDFKWASVLLTEAQRATNQVSRTLFVAGLNAYALGRIAQSIELLERALQDPSLSSENAQTAQHALALAKFQLDPAGTAHAPAVISAALKHDQDFAPALIASGLLAEQKKDYAGARSYYERVLRATPAHLLARRQLALLLAEKLNDDSNATQQFAALRAELPADPQMNKSMGKIAFRRGEYKEAVRLLTDSNSKAPNDPDLLIHLGLAQHSLKNKQAKAYLQQALLLDTNSTLTAVARKALTEMN